jgi:hypothetical protein
METSTLIILGAVFILALVVVYYYFYQKDKKSMATPTPPSPTVNASLSLQLQAYERLVILAERIAIPNLVSRLNQPGLSKTDMQVMLNETIKQEFDHNLSQQIYVSKEAWEALRNLKEQNMHLINQMASILPQEATGLDLNKKLLDFVVHQQNGSLHTMVQEALSFEAKKLMQ